jgi:hypothetical protein
MEMAIAAAAAAIKKNGCEKIFYTLDDDTILDSLSHLLP